MGQALWRRGAGKLSSGERVRGPAPRRRLRRHHREPGPGRVSRPQCVCEYMGVYVRACVCVRVCVGVNTGCEVPLPDAGYDVIIGRPNLPGDRGASFC